MVFHLSVHGPDVFLVFAADENVVDRGHCRQHGVVLVVVLVHAIAANQEEVGKFVEIGAHFGETFVPRRDGGHRRR